MSAASARYRVGLKPDPQALLSSRLWVVALLICFCTPASAQSIFKCKGADGRITYSSVPCAGEALPMQGRPAAITATAASRANAPPAPGAPPPTDDATAPSPMSRAPLPKQCDNAAPLKAVVARLDAPATPDDLRSFLADERFRLLRCEFTRFSSEERRERDAAIRGLEGGDAARRRTLMMRIEALYERYLTPSERTARARARQR